MIDSPQHSVWRLLPVLWLLVPAHLPAFAQQPSSGLAQVNGTTLYYEIMGQGPPLILISGGGNLDLRLWDDQFKPFAEFYRVVRYDVRGIGKSGIPLKPYSPCTDLFELMKFLHLSRANVIGVSFGGRIALDFALEHPEMVENLVLAAPGLSGHGNDEQLIEALHTLSIIARRGGIDKAVEIALDNPFLPEDAVARERITRILFDNAHMFYLGFPLITLMQSPDPPAVKRLSQVQPRTLILIGEKDHATMRSIADSLENKIAGARKVTIPQAAHFLNIERPAEFNRVVLDFLKGTVSK